MNLNVLTYPCKVMRITQSYFGTTSHLEHTTGEPKDYPIDEGCEDAGRSPFYCPCDEMVIKRIYGVGTKGTNTIWLESTRKVLFADGSEDYCTILITHPNDDELKKLKTGKAFKRNEKIITEGKDGCTGYHFHISVGKGKMKGNGWTKNSKGKWVLSVTTDTVKPEDAFYVNTEFTKILNSKNIQFKAYPLQYKVSYPLGNYRVTKANVLNVRKTPGTDGEKVLYQDMTESAKNKILKIAGSKVNGYVKGLTFTAFEVKNNWGRTPSGWVCLDYCEVLKK